MISDTPRIHAETVLLRVQAPGGDVAFRQITCGELLLIGSGSSCGLLLPQCEAAAMHCTLSFAGGKIKVRDWNTGAGTLIDGEKIDAEVELPPGGEIQIGAYRMTVGDDDADPAELVGRVRETHPHDAQQLPTTAQALDGVSFTHPAEPRARREPPQGYATGPFDDDTLELLKAELEILQSELAQRDARLAELESLAGMDGAYVDSSPEDESPEVERLVARLEQLLDELQRCDERMSTMADLLRAADDAREAELEERRQIESWIGEIERRLSERDEERKAEQQALRQTVADLTAQLARAEQQLDQAAAGSDAAGEQNGYLAGLRREKAALEEKLRQSEAERERLSERLEAADVETAEARARSAIDDAVREEKLAMAQERTTFSQERAAFARERAELVRLRDQLEEEQRKLATDPDNADQRIRTFREHLREIHAKEIPPVKPQGLSARIGKIWRRLEGRPLDTD